ncbi:MAG: SDR family NAD(P)-dependent oxidoreductase, partial [Chloroflexi bacterium]|nr:SDR family NAD(P)-dependent oxidoreductase [Chloroflexota bacterium]
MAYWKRFWWPRASRPRSVTCSAASKEPKMVLEGKVALVTGGGQGLGRTLALGLAAAGADVVVAQRTVSRVEAVAAEIQDLGRRALAMHVDVTQKASVQAMIDTTVSTLGRLDVLVNNSGIFPITQVARMSEEEWDQVMATNL